MDIMFIFRNEIIGEARLTAIPAKGDHVTFDDFSVYVVRRRNWYIDRDQVNVELEDK